MSQKTVRVAFAAKNFASGQNVTFKIYDHKGKKVFQGPGDEWAHEGVYYIEKELKFTGNEVYLAVAEEAGGKWKASKIVTKSDQI